MTRGTLVLLLALLACGSEQANETVQTEDATGRSFAATAAVTLRLSPDTIYPAVDSTATLTATASSAIAVKWWSQSGVTVKPDLCTTPCSVLVTGKSRGTARIEAHHYGGTTRDTVWAMVGGTPPDTPPPPPPPPVDTTPAPPPVDTTPVPQPPPPPSPAPPARGCPSSGYVRVVSVSTAGQLASALSGAQPGDQIRVAGGTYLGATALSRSGTAASRITLCGIPGTWPILKGGRFTLKASWITVTGLVFEGPNGGQNNVYISGTTGVRFTGNEVRNGDWHAGIAIETSKLAELTYNYIHDNGRERIDHGIYYRAQASTGPSDGNLVANNVIVGNAGRGISMHDNGGGAVSWTRVAHNTIVRNGSTGILHNVNAGTGNALVNNLLADNGWIEGYKQIRVSSGTGNRITNNLAWSPVASRQGIEIGTSGNLVENNPTTDPLLVIPYTDLHLRAGSPAIGLGLPGYATDDFTGKVRDAEPDAGAFER